MEDIEEKLTSYLTGELDEAGCLKVEAWINQSAENKKTADDMFYIIQTTNKVNLTHSVDVDEAYDKFTSRLYKRHNKSLFLVLQRVAAVLFLPVLTVAAYLYFKPEVAEETPYVAQYIEVKSKPGMVSTVDLPDGSKVWLNACSSIKYPIAFSNDKRTVELNGQAYFDVARDENKPFVVNTSAGYLIEVLGTEFNVTAYDNDNVIETTLVEGSVKINITEDGRDYPVTQLLEPNQMAAYNKKDNSLNVDVVEPKYETAWKEGMIIFKDSHMDRVLKVLARYYNVRFRVTNPKVMESVITGKFENEQLYQLLEYLHIASGINYKLYASTITDDNGIDIKTIEIF